MKRMLALLLCALICVGMLAGCQKEAPDLEPTTQPETTQPTETQPTAATPLPEGEGTLNIASSADVSTLNPHNYSMSRDADAIDFTGVWLYKSFIGDNYKFTYLPEFAADYPQQMNDSRTVWQIPLREGLTWANGDPMNADTVIYSWKALLDPKLVNSRVSYLADNTIVIVNATEYAEQGSSGTVVKWEDVGIKKIDDKTIEITTTGAVDADEILDQLSNTPCVMVHEATYEAAMNADHTATMYGTSKDTYMCAGSFIIKDWVPGASISYQKNPNYVYADKIWVNTVNDRTVSDASTRLQLFLNGELDYVSLGDEDYKQYAEDPRVIESPATSMRHISVNMGNTEKPILQSKNFRLALYYGTNRDAVASISESIPAWWIQPLMVIGDLETGESYRDLVKEQDPGMIPENNGYDPEKAVQYFEAALAESGTTKAELTMLYSSDTATYKAASEYLQKSWTELFGADRFALELQGMPNSQMTATKKSWKDNPNAYELAWGAWGTSKIAPWNGFNVWRTGYAKKNEPYSNTELDELWVKANQSEERFDKAKRLEMTFRMEQIMLDDAAIIPVMETPAHYLKADKVVLPTPDNSYVVNVGFGWQYARIVEGQ